MPQKWKSLFTYILICSLTVILFTYSDTSLEHARRSLELCAKSLIPSLFRFLVLCELITKSGLGMKVGRFFSFPAKKLFGVSDGGACAIFCGAVCGFPVGALCAVSLYKNGDISKSELLHLLLFCNNTGPGFLVSGVGIALFGSARFGLILYICQLISAFIMGAATKRYFPMPTKKESAVRTLPLTGASLFTEGITKAGASMLNVCAYIVFFSTLSGILSTFLPEVLVCGLLEISSGCLAVTKLLDFGLSPVLSASLCAFFIGWAGLSVHAQTAALCKDENISLLPYVIAKFIQGLVCAALVYLFFAIFGESALPVFAAADTPHFAPVILSFLTNSVFIFAILKNLIKKGSKKRFFVIS